jgi:hypothetical protein
LKFLAGVLAASGRKQRERMVWMMRLQEYSRSPDQSLWLRHDFREEIWMQKCKTNIEKHGAFLWQDYGK